MRTIAHLPGILHLTQGDARAACDAADAIGTEPDDLLCCIGFETAGEWSPATKNHAGSGAVGLIQFMPSTAAHLGTSTEALGAMSFREQLVYVERYFASFHLTSGVEPGPLDSLHALYMAILWPRAIREADSFIIFSKGTTAYAQNIGFDKPGENGQRKGWVTRGDVCGTIDAFMSRAKGLPRLGIPDDDSADDGPLRTVDELRAAATPLTPPPPPADPGVEPETPPPPPDVDPCERDQPTTDERAVLVDDAAKSG